MELIKLRASWPNTTVIIYKRNPIFILTNLNSVNIQASNQNGCERTNIKSSFFATKLYCIVSLNNYINW